MHAESDEQNLSEHTRQQFLEAANTDYVRLRGDRAAWEEELAERRLWDQTLLDGLENGPDDV